MHVGDIFESSTFPGMLPVETFDMDDEERRTCSASEGSFSSSSRKSPASLLAMRGDNVMKEKPGAALPGLGGRTTTHKYNTLYSIINEQRPNSIQPRVECTLEEVQKFTHPTHPELKM